GSDVESCETRSRAQTGRDCCPRFAPRSHSMSPATSVTMLFRLSYSGIALLFMPQLAGAFTEMDSPLVPRTASEIRVLLAREIDFPGIDDPKTTLQQALAMLTDRYGLTFRVNEAAFKKEGFDDVLKTPVVMQKWPPWAASDQAERIARPLRARS